MLFKLSSLLLQKKNKQQISIISRDCLGGMVYKNMNAKFLSPTIGLYFDQKDFSLFITNLKEYLEGQLLDISAKNSKYPKAILKPKTQKLPGILINFMHYKSFKEAAKKWYRRVKRINFNNIFVLNNLRTMDDVIEFNRNNIATVWNKVYYKKCLISCMKVKAEDNIIIPEIQSYKHIRKGYEKVAATISKIVYEL